MRAGDNQLTALSVARECHMVHAEGTVVLVSASRRACPPDVASAGTHLASFSPSKPSYTSQSPVWQALERLLHESPALDVTLKNEDGVHFILPDHSFSVTLRSLYYYTVINCIDDGVINEL